MRRLETADDAGSIKTLANKAIHILITALNGENSYVGGKAAGALGQIGSIACLEKLLQSAPTLI